MDEEPTHRTWTYAGLVFTLSNRRDRFHLGACRASDGVAVGCGITLDRGDLDEGLMQELYLARLTNADKHKVTLCYACGCILRPDSTTSSYQFDNALWVKFSGGYGMFVESKEFGGPDDVVICHGCAHDLCDRVPWVHRLIDPYNSHSHSTEYHREHPDHQGWDY